MSVPQKHEWHLVEARDLRWEAELELVRTTHWVERRPLVWVEAPYDHSGASVMEVMEWVHEQETHTEGEWQVSLIFPSEWGRASLTIYGRDPLDQYHT